MNDQLDTNVDISWIKVVEISRSVGYKHSNIIYLWTQVSVNL